MDSLDFCTPSMLSTFCCMVWREPSHLCQPLDPLNHCHVLISQLELHDMRPYQTFILLLRHKAVWFKSHHHFHRLFMYSAETRKIQYVNITLLVLSTTHITNIHSYATSKRFLDSDFGWGHPESWIIIAFKNLLCGKLSNWHCRVSTVMNVTCRTHCALMTESFLCPHWRRRYANGPHTSPDVICLCLWLLHKWGQHTV